MGERLDGLIKDIVYVVGSLDHNWRRCDYVVAFDWGYGQMLLLP